MPGHHGMSFERGRTSRGGGRQRVTDTPATRGPAPSRSPGKGVSAARDRGERQQAVTEVQQRQERAESSMANVPSVLTGLMLGLGSAMRSEIVRQIEAGGTPVREGGMVIGVMSNGRYTGRQREADRLANQESDRGDGASQAAQMGAGAPQPDQPAAEPAGPPVVRRSALAQQIEAENRRRRLAGMRRLGSRTLLSGDRFSADTLGA